MRVIGTDGEEDTGGNFFVGTGGVEGVAVEDGRSGENVDVRDAREGGQGEGGEREQKDGAAAKSHCEAV